MTHRAAAVIGLGNLGRLYAGGWLRAGYAVHPIGRRTDARAVLNGLPERTPLLCAVGEASLANAVEAVPPARRGDLIFVQNELFPEDLQRLGTPDATIAVVWTLVKAGFPLILGRRLAVTGPQEEAFAEACAALEHPVLAGAPIGWECATKYAFIVAMNALGLLRADTLGAWLADDPERVEALIADACRVALARIGAPETDLARAVAEVAEGVEGFRALPCRGRSSAARVARALNTAETLGIHIPALRDAAEAS